VNQPADVIDSDSAGRRRRDPVSAQRAMELPSKEVLLDAARRAQLLYPGPVGELLHQELVSWLQFGHLLGSALIFRIADELIHTPYPAAPEEPDRAAPFPSSSPIPT
jgi:hypothetical protein